MTAGGAVPAPGGMPGGAQTSSPNPPPVFLSPDGSQGWIGVPSTPEPAYPNQPMPQPYLYTPPVYLNININTGSSPPANGFYYAPPPNYSPPSGYDMPAVPAFPVATGAPPPAVAPPPLRSEASYTLRFANGGRHSTRVQSELDAEKKAYCTHLNFHNNDIASIGDLEHFPSLVRLTVSSNLLESLQGCEAAPFLRWIDASNNNLRTLTGLSNIRCLEWLNINSNHLPDLRGVGDAPRLTWLDASNSDMKSLDGIQPLGELRFVSVRKNYLTSLHGIEACGHLQEIDASMNDLTDISAVARIPGLLYLNLESNYLTDVSPLVHCVNLRGVTLDNNDFHSTRSVVALAQLPYLEWISIRKNEYLKAADIKDLKNAFAQAGKTHVKIVSDGPCACSVQ